MFESLVIGMVPVVYYGYHVVCVCVGVLRGVLGLS